MRNAVEVYPERKFYSLTDLEKRLGFSFLSKNAFENENEKEIIFEKGIQKKKNHQVKTVELENGKLFKDKIKAAYIPCVSIRFIHEKIGYGMFVEEDLPEDSYVGEYTGIVRQNDRRYFEPLNNYCYEYPVSDDIGRSYVIDATCGNLTRFINHSFEPNLKPIYAFIEGFYHLIFISIKTIKTGTQLTYNYGNNYWYLRESPFDWEHK